MAADFLPGNRLTLLNCGAEYFPALIAAIDGAHHEIHLETYIFEADDTGRAITSALSRASERGVAVRLLVDGFGSPAFADTLMPGLLAAGVHVLIYRRELARFRLRRHRLRRLHRKLAVIDGRIAFAGGINVIDDMNHHEGPWPRYDYAVQVQGPLLDPMHRAVSRLWEGVSWASFRRRFKAQHKIERGAAPAGNQRAAFIVRDNLLHRRDIEEAYLSAIADAQSEIVLANAYFLPGYRLRHALFHAAQRGVRITILLQGRAEYRLQHYATQALFGALLAAGIRIFEYRRSFLHAKVAVIDERWATVGSSNIDPFSLLLAREANIVATDVTFAAELRRSLLQGIADGAVELRPQDWQRLSLVSRLLRWVSYQLVRLAIGIAGYGGKH